MTTATPTLANTATSYGAVAKTLHWVTALLILTAIPLGVIANQWAYDTSDALATKSVLFSLHKTIGLAAFFVAVLRILWALSQPKPGLLNAERKLESWLAETVHWLLYASLVIVPLSGWLHHAATSGFAPVWWPFGQTLPFVPVDDGLAKFFAGWHWVFTKVLAASLVLHIAGALKHHLVDRDLTLARMLPGHTATPEASAAHPRAPIWAAFGIYAAAMVLGSVLGLASGPARGVQTAQIEAAPSQWQVETGSLGITVAQLGSSVTGQFESWSAAINFDPDAPDAAKGDVRVEIAIPSLRLGSITSEALAPEFFDAEAHPTAIFAGRIAATGAAEAYVADGTLTLRGIEAPVSLPFTMTIDGDTATMSGQTTLDRRTFEMGTRSYNDEQTVGFAVDVAVALTATLAAD